MDPAKAAEEIAAGRLDAVGIARQNLVDPEWVNKILEDRVEDIKPCINCHNACFSFNKSEGTPNMQPMDDSLHLARCALTPSTMQHNKYKIVPTRKPKKVAIIGGGISAVGGMVYITTIAGCVWNHEGLSGVGWLAVALVIFATWRTVNAIWGSYLFGLLFWVYLIIPGLGRRDTYLFNMLPYLVTIAVLIFVSLRNKKENQPPASLGLAYFREER